MQKYENKLNERKKILEKVINFVHQLKEDIKREEKEKTKKI